MKARFFSAVLAAMMLACASVGITASAEEAEQAAADVTETTAADNSEGDSSETETEENAESTEVTAETSSVSEDMNTVGVDMEQFMEIMGQLAGNGTGTITITPDDNSTPDYYGDPYYDTDGNATLIKSEQIIYNTEEMQFIAVTTKDGHVFYVLINYTAANGEDNVYFLNKVDDYDLYALLYAGAEDDDEKNKITPEQAAQAAEKANGRVKPDSDTDTAETAETDESGEDTTEEIAPQQNNVNMNSVYLVFGAIALIGIGAAGFFLMKKKNGGKPAVQEESDYDDETEIEEVADDDYPDYLDDGKDEN